MFISSIDEAGQKKKHRRMTADSHPSIASAGRLRADAIDGVVVLWVSLI
jgi:hypothetical protein